MSEVSDEIFHHKLSPIAGNHSNGANSISYTEIIDQNFMKEKKLVSILNYIRSWVSLLIFMFYWAFHCESQ